jgi:Protein of unknown function (DUF3592)
MTDFGLAPFPSPRSQRPRALQVQTVLMPGLGARLIVYGFFGAFGLVGLLSLAIALNATVQRVTFLRAALPASGTVLEMRPAHTSRQGAGNDIPVFRFRATDGRNYLQVSDVSVRRGSLAVGESVRVLYLPGEPQSARLDGFSALWQYPLVFAVVGGTFLGVALWSFGRMLRLRRSPAVSSPLDETFAAGGAQI